MPIHSRRRASRREYCPKQVIELVASFHENPNLFIVGDEKQAIFRFQGASLENFLYFKRRFPKALLVSLSENYRSHQTILDASQALIENNPAQDESLKASLTALPESARRKISCIAAPDMESELRFVATETDKLIQGGVEPKEIAVLVRNNSHADAVERVLSAKGVPVARYADADALDHAYSDAFFSLIRAALSPTDDSLVAKALFAPFLKIDPIEISRTLDMWRKNKGSLIDALKSRETTNAFALLVARFARIVSSDPLVLAFETIALESGFIEFLLSHRNSRNLVPLYAALLGTVVRFAERERTATMRAFMERLDHAREHGYSITASVVPPEGVELMTAHGSKGLEFEYVFIIHASDNIWGGKQARRAFKLPVKAPSPEGEGAEDERRLFYVALTRAKKHAYVTYAEKDSEGRELSPSRFIFEMTDAHVEHAKAAPPQELPQKREASISIFTDKEYLKKLFLERGFSVTHLNNYIECPWKYFFLNLLWLPKSQENPQMYGSAVHAALCYYFEAYKREEDVSIDAAIHIFESTLLRTHMTERDLADYIQSGREEIKKYLENYDFPRNIWNEYKIPGVPFKAFGEEIRLTGNLDKVEIKESSRVNVVDYKTGKPKSRNAIEGKTKSADGNYKRQIVFYKLLLDRYKSGEWKMETGTLDFIKPDDAGRIRREVFVITDEEVAELETVVSKTIEEILSLSFMDRQCEKEDCEWCKLKRTILER